jgi:hypothetical protein
MCQHTRPACVPFAEMCSLLPTSAPSEPRSRVAILTFFVFFVCCWSCNRCKKNTVVFSNEILSTIIENTSIVIETLKLFRTNILRSTPADGRCVESEKSETSFIEAS